LIQNLLSSIALAETEGEYETLLNDLRVAAESAGVECVAAQIALFLAWVRDVPTAPLVLKAFYDLPVTPNQAAAALLPFANSCQYQLAEIIGLMLTNFSE